MVKRGKRSMRSIRWVMTLAVAVLIPLISDANQSIAASSSDSGPLKDVTLETAALQLASDAGIEVDDARNQMSVQRGREDLAAAASKALGQEWAGSWIDHSGGGRLVLLSTNIGRLENWIDQQDTAAVGVVSAAPAAYSLQTLATVSSSLIKTVPVGVSTWVKMSTNEVVVEVATDQWLVERKLDPRSILANLKRILEGARIPFELVRTDPSTPASCKSATYSICTSPLRGGVELLQTENGYGSTNVGKTSICSAGFIVVKEGQRYLMTAGHCRVLRDNNDNITATVQNSWSARNTASDHTSYFIGVAAWADTIEQLGATPARDWSFVKIGTQGGWATGAYANVLASSVTVSGTTYTTTADEYYPINAVGTVSTMPESSYLCHTGATALTKCGPFLSVDSVGRGVTRMPTCRGDSGGSVFIGGRGYGIVSVIQGNTTFDGHTYWSGTSASAGVENGPDADGNPGMLCYSPGNGNGSSRFQFLQPALSWFGASLI